MLGFFPANPGLIIVKHRNWTSGDSIHHIEASDPPQIKAIEEASARLEIRVTPVGRRTIGENEMALEYAQWKVLAGVKAVTEDLITSSLGCCPPLDDAEHKR